MSDVPSADRGRTRRTYAHLTILSDVLAPGEMEATVAVAPDVTWAKGDLHKGERPRKFNAIAFESDLDRERSGPDEHIDALVQRLRPHAQAIAKLAADERVHSARLWLYWDTTGGNPGLSFSQETLHAIAALGVTLDLDIYVFPDEDE